MGGEGYGCDLTELSRHKPISDVNNKMIVGDKALEYQQQYLNTIYNMYI
jgi:hypothetical protein